MASWIRLVLGVAVLIGSWVVKQKASVASAESGEEAMVALYGREMAASSLNFVILGFVLVGVAMIILGVVGLQKQKSRG